jgi:HEAT repeat protein
MSGQSMKSLLRFLMLNKKSYIFLTLIASIIVVSGCSKNCNSELVQTCKNKKDIKCLTQIVDNFSCKPSIKYSAIDALAEINNESSAEALKDLLGSKNPSIREQVVRKLGEKYYEGAVKLLLEAIKDKDPNVGDSAALSLAFYKDQTDSTIKKLKTYLKSDRTQVRANAILVASKLEDNQFIEDFTIALTDKDELVRSRAAEGLFNLGDQGIKVLLAHIKDENAEVRKQVIIVLSKADDEVSVAPLIERLNDENFQVRAQAALELGMKKSLKAVDPLIQALDDSEARVKKNAAYALGEIKDPKAIQPLIDSLQDPYKEVIEESSKALIKITGKNFEKDFKAWDKWWQKTAPEKTLKLNNKPDETARDSA